MNSLLETYHQQLLILLDVMIAGALSGLVGIEREKFKKPAGLRTNMIVGSISCFFVSISNVLIEFLSGGSGMQNLSVDPIRIIQAIVVGISFIGAGTILKSDQKNSVFYLTTAATLLYSSAIGISVALKQYVLAVGLSLLILIINWVINNMEKYFLRK